MSHLQAWWQGWLVWLDHTEVPSALAWVRIALGLTIFYDFAAIELLGIGDGLFLPPSAGGFGLAYEDPSQSPMLTGRVLNAVCMLLAGSFTLGLFTRTSALLLVLAWARAHDLLPGADRGIDMLCRNMLLLMAFSPAGERFGLDAAWRTRSFVGDDTPFPSWTRRLIIVQIVVMYFTAGIQKVGIHWWPMGDFAALYYILLDPNLARFDLSGWTNWPWFRFSQLSTLWTVVFQGTYPVVCLWLWYRATPDRPGKLRALANRYKLEWWWIAMGAAFHVALFLTLELGIFPAAMLALYPAFVGGLWASDKEIHT